MRHDERWQLETEPRQLRQDVQLLRLSQDRDMKTMSQGSLKTRHVSRDFVTEYNVSKLV